MKKLRIKNEGNDVVGLIPETWDELKVKHFLVLESDFQEVDFIATFMDVRRDVIENLTGDLSIVIETIHGLFNEKPPDFKKAKKKILTMEGKQIHFPKTLDFTRYGQKSMLKNIVQKEGGLESEISTIFAIYAQPLIDDKFDSKRIPDIKKLVDEMPILDVYPYVVFFFQEIKRIEESFANQVNAIPKTSEQAEYEILARASGGARLDKFGDFAVIDNLVQNYNGTYTHDDIFDMDVIMVHNMILYSRECAYVQSATQSAHREINKAKK